MFRLSLRWRDILTIPVNLNHSYPKDNYNPDGFCALASIVVIELLWNNIFVDDCFNFHTTNTGAKPSIDTVTAYVTELLVDLETISIQKKYWLFLCNYARTVLQNITFFDENKSLNDYKREYLRVHENDDPFKIISALDIIDRSTTTTPFISVKIREYLLKQKIYSGFCGIRFGENVHDSELIALKQRENGFEFFKMKFSMKKSKNKVNRILEIT
jgi:hypothetical protein